jgi:hypothetical protein
VIEEALRRELGFDLLERLWERNEFGEDEAVALAVEAQHKTRRRRRWVRAVLDPNVLIAALLSPTGAPAQLVGRWLGGEFELVVSDATSPSSPSPNDQRSKRRHVNRRRAERLSARGWLSARRCGGSGLHEAVS